MECAETFFKDLIMRQVPNDFARIRSIHDFFRMKEAAQKISMVTCYDYTSACIVAASHIDCILVGDTSAMLMHGHPTTVPATTEMIATHVAAVVRGAPDKFIVGDMPFCSYRKSLSETMGAVQTLMQAGAKAIKLEGASGNLETVKHIVESGVPVMGHVGLTPQSIHQLGGFRVQGKNKEDEKRLFEDALALEKAGCFALVLECVPHALAEKISKRLRIPTIGIGAGSGTDGQVLVFQDMLGMNNGFSPRFLKTYLNGFDLIKGALNQYDAEVKQVVFPEEEHCY